MMMAGGGGSTRPLLELRPRRHQSGSKEAVVVLEMALLGILVVHAGVEITST